MGELQRWLCRDCGYRFSEAKSLQENLRCHINTAGTIVSRSQVCDLLTEGSKNLTEQPQLKGLAGATEQEAKGLIVEFMWTLKQKGYRESTIHTDVQQLKILAKRWADITDPESVKATIAKQPWNQNRKARVVAVYTLFLKTQGKTWEPPIYKPVPEIFHVPTEQEIDTLISGAGRKLSCYIQFLKETGCRSGELDMLRWQDVDFERGVARITPEKGSYPRILPLSVKCLAMLKNLKRTDDLVFGNLSSNCMRINLCNTRKKLARKLDNPRLSLIHFHSIRHWKATTLYHQTKDILHVKAFMGHRRIESTLVYVQIESALYQSLSDDWTCKVAETTEQVKELIGTGFEFVLQKDNLAYFRKRK